MESYYSDYFQDKKQLSKPAHQSYSYGKEEEEYDTAPESKYPISNGGANGYDKPKSGGPANTKIYVSNMKSTTDERELSGVF